MQFKYIFKNQHKIFINPLTPSLSPTGYLKYKSVLLGNPCKSCAVRSLDVQPLLTCCLPFQQPVTMIAAVHFFWTCVV